MANEYDVDRIGIDIEIDTKNSSEKIDEIDKKLEKLQQTLSKGWDFSSAEKAVEKISDMKLPKLKWQDTVSDKLSEAANGMKKVSASASKVDTETKKAAVSMEYLTSGAAKIDYLSQNLASAKSQLQELANAGEGYANPAVQKRFCNNFILYCVFRSCGQFIVNSYFGYNGRYNIISVNGDIVASGQFILLCSF